MRTKQLFQGLNNSQKIRVILNGVGFYTTVKGVDSMPFAAQRAAVHSTLMMIGSQGLQGFATRQRVYSENMAQEDFEVQVDLV